MEITDADGKAKGVPEFEEVGHSMEVVWPLTDMEVKDTLQAKIKEMGFQISFVNTECL